MIETVCGKIEKGDLGITSAHEHVFINMKNCVDITGKEPSIFKEKMSTSNRYAVFCDPYAILDNALVDEFDVAVEELKLFKQAGGNSLIDCTLDEIGRDPEKLKRVSELSKVNIVMGSGHYYQKAHFSWVKDKSVKDISDEIRKDLTEGVHGTNIKAGIIGEIGTSAVMSEDEKKVLHSAGIVSFETDKAIHIHTDLYTENGFEIIKILTGEGAKPNRICIDHIDVLIRPEYIFKLLDFGVYIEFDDFGKEFYMGGTKRFAYDLERVKIIKEIISKGYEKQILMSNDICLKSMLAHYGGNGFAHLLKGVKDMFIGEGIGEKTYKKILTENVLNFID